LFLKTTCKNTAAAAPYPKWMIKANGFGVIPNDLRKAADGGILNGATPVPFIAIIMSINIKSDPTSPLIKDLIHAFIFIIFHFFGFILTLVEPFN